MARLALGLRVPAGESKVSLRMIEPNILPASLVMTILTLRTKLSLVGIVCAVAGDARRWRHSVWPARDVTRGTGDLGVH